MIGCISAADIQDNTTAVTQSSSNPIVTTGNSINLEET
jgi:hypothetical protein